eukprot:gene15525-15672_t
MGKLRIAIVLTAIVPQLGRAADAEHGETIAKRWCATCHVISADQKRGGDNVPTFKSVAQEPDFNAKMLAFFLLAPHPKMPDMALTRKEAEDIAAYISRLND